MSQRQLIGAGLVLALLLVAGFVMFGRDDRATGDEATGRAGPTGTSPSTQPREGDDASGPATTSPTSPTSPASTSDSGATAGHEKKAKGSGHGGSSASEVLPAGSTPTYHLPGMPKQHPSATPRPLLSLPLPETASAKWAIVKGFPRRLIPVPPGSHVTNSSVASQGTTLQVTLVGRAAGNPRGVLAVYRSSLSAKGFDEARVQAVDGSAASSFLRGEDNLVVTVTPTKGRPATYTVFAVLHAGQAR